MNNKYLDKVDAASYIVKITTLKNNISSAIDKAIGYSNGKDAEFLPRVDGKPNTGKVGHYSTDIKTEELTKSFTIKDTQPTLTIVQVKNNVDANTAEDAIKKSCEVTYDGVKFAEADKYDTSKLIIDCSTNGSDSKVASKDAQYYKNGKVYNIVKLNIFINVGAEGYGKNESGVTYAKVKFEKKPGFSITVND